MSIGTRYSSHGLQDEQRGRERARKEREREFSGLQIGLQEYNHEAKITSKFNCFMGKEDLNVIVKH